MRWAFRFNQKGSHFPMHKQGPIAIIFICTIWTCEGDEWPKPLVNGTDSMCRLGGSKTSATSLTMKNTSLDLHAGNLGHLSWCGVKHLEDRFIVLRRFFLLIDSLVKFAPLIAFDRLYLLKTTFDRVPKFGLAKRWALYTYYGALTLNLCTIAFLLLVGLNLM